LTYKLGVAFFFVWEYYVAFVSEYFEVKRILVDQYRGFFRWLILL
jgi:hypothetical protein